MEVSSMNHFSESCVHETLNLHHYAVSQLACHPRSLPHKAHEHDSRLNIRRDTATRLSELVATSCSLALLSVGFSCVVVVQKRTAGSQKILQWLPDTCCQFCGSW